MANSSAIFSRLHTWSLTDTVLAVDLNAEFNNILQNLNPPGIGGYSSTVTQMQIQTAPGGVGSEVLATALSGELERLRYQIATLQGTTYWYQTPTSTIAQLNSALGTALLSNRISSGVTSATGQPAFLIPDGTVNRVTLSTSTAFVYSISGTQYTISSNVTLAGLATAGASAAATTMVVADTSITSSQSWTQYIGENGSTLTVGTMGTSITALVGKIAAFKNVTSSEYFIGRVTSTTTLMNIYRGYLQTGASSFGTRSNVTNGDVIQLMALTWIYATTAGALTSVSTNPSYQGTAPGTPTTGDYWFDTSTNIWKTYNGSSWVAAGATLIGISVQDPTKTIGTRAFDFFNTFSSTNTIELFTSSQDAAFAARSRYQGSTCSVYGTTLNFSKNVLGWTATGSGLIDSTTLTAGNVYYFYLSNAGNTYVSSIAPYDRLEDLLGYYHPSSPYRCLGLALCSNAGTPLFTDCESFYKNDFTAPVSSVTAAGSNLLMPYSVATRERIVTCNAAGGAFTQQIPPPIMWKGQSITYVKTDSTLNAVTLQAFGQSVLTTTANITAAGTNIGTLAATTGLTASTPYFISGPGIVPGTTVTFAGGLATGVLSQAPYQTVTTGAVTIATANGISFITNPLSGINGNFTTLLSTTNESITLVSDGVAVYIRQRYIPSVWSNPVATKSPALWGGTTTAPTPGTMASDRFMWRRQSNCAEFYLEFCMTGLGTAGSGNYLLTLPNSLNMDTNIVTTYSTSIAQAAIAPVRAARGYGHASYLTSLCGDVCAIPYSATQVRFYGEFGSSPTIFDSASNWAMGAAALTCIATFELPILNWNSSS